jgi:hypothetical protein
MKDETDRANNLLSNIETKDAALKAQKEKEIKEAKRRAAEHEVARQAHCQQVRAVASRPRPPPPPHTTHHGGVCVGEAVGALLSEENGAAERADPTVARGDG